MTREGPVTDIRLFLQVDWSLCSTTRLSLPHSLDFPLPMHRFWTKPLRPLKPWPCAWPLLPDLLVPTRETRRLSCHPTLLLKPLLSCELEAKVSVSRFQSSRTRESKLPSKSMERTALVFSFNTPMSTEVSRTGNHLLKMSNPRASNCVLRPTSWP